MKRLIFAIALTGVTSVVVCEASMAAPIAPLPAAAIAGTDDVVQAYYWHHHYYPYHWHHHYYHHRHWYHHHWHYW